MARATTATVAYTVNTAVVYDQGLDETTAAAKVAEIKAKFEAVVAELNLGNAGTGIRVTSVVEQ